MDILKREDVKELLAKSGNFCVSIYMPTHRTGREQQQDPIRLKNLLTRAEEELKAYDMRTPEAQAILSPAENLLSDPDFWQHQSDGLAIFLADDFALNFRLPQSFDELLRINRRFHTKPMLPLLSRDNQFYILSLSKKGVELHQATRFAIDQIDLSGIPTSVEEALWFDDPEKHLDFHTSTDTPSGAGGERPAVFHGHGVVNEEKTSILRFFQRLDRHLQDFLENDHIPLVLAGIDYLHPIYRQANTYPDLLETGITVSHEELSEDQLHQKAWEVVTPFFEKERKNARDSYLMYAGDNSQMASADLATVVQAAYYEAVDTLFVPNGVQKWGSFNPQKNETIIHDQEQAGDTDLLDFAAMYTLKNSGTVYVVAPDEVPDKRSLAAVFRYEYEPSELEADRK